MSTITGWVKDLRATLSMLHKSARSHQIKSKEVDKESYDKKARERVFHPGDMVLLHNNSISTSLELVSYVTYYLEDRCTRKEVLYIDYL